MKRITLAVIESYYLIREAIAQSMTTLGFDVIIKTGDYADFVHQSKPLVPDICLIEAVAPTLGYSEIISNIRKQYPAIKIIGYTLGEQEYIAREHPGIDLFISKGTDTDVIKKRITALAYELKPDSS